MNDLLKRNLTLCTLTLLISVPLSLKAVTNPLRSSSTDLVSAPVDLVPMSEEKLDYENAFQLMKDFLDLSVKPEKSMNYWVKQLMGLIKKKGDDKVESLKPFLKEFNTALRSRQPALIGLAFKNHKERFGEPALTKHVKDMLNQPNGLTKITTILQARLQK